MIDRLLTAEEVAFRLGLAGPETVWYLARSGELDYVRIGKRHMRFPPEIVDAYIERQTNKPLRLSRLSTA